MTATSYLAQCYGGDIDALADVAGDFDAASPEDAAAWNLRQWTAIAETLGFARELADAVAAIRGTRLGLTGIHAAALGAFDRWSIVPRRPFSTALSAAMRSRRAQVRQEVLLPRTATRNAWTLDDSADRLPGGACFATGPNSAVSGRAFLVDAGANFFHEARPSNTTKSACQWSTPVYLSLGTYPWIYGNKLHRTPPGLDWDAAPPWNPAATAMRIAASLWQPLGNLEQDATLVAQRYRHYIRAADLALAPLPLWQANSTAPLTRRGLLLHAPHGSLDIAGANSPFGYLAATAHNFIIGRFAAFFAVRRAVARAVRTLPIELRRAITQNPDACLRRLTRDVPIGSVAATGA